MHSCTKDWSAGNFISIQNNPKEKHLWDEESPVALFEVVWEQFIQILASRMTDPLVQLNYANK